MQKAELINPHQAEVEPENIDGRGFVSINLKSKTPVATEDGLYAYVRNINRERRGGLPVLSGDTLRSAWQGTSSNRDSYNALSTKLIKCRTNSL